MCVKMNEDLVELVAALILSSFGNMLDFNAEIQP